jgi:hypothetical protein
MTVIDVGVGDGHQAAEKAWIAEHLRRGASLTNIAPGGIGAVPPRLLTTIEKLRAAATGRRHSTITRQKMSERLKARWRTAERDMFVANSRAQPPRTTSNETREKMRLAKTGKKQSPEMIARRAAGLKGHVVSLETKEKISASKRGIPRDADTRAKISKSLRSRATRAKESRNGEAVRHDEHGD